jgi:FSR family fosmidomycin resistance protein-like MFS transporter
MELSNELEKGKNFQTGNVILISIAHFVHDVYSSFLAPLLPLLIEKLSMSYSQAGFLTVLQRLPSLLNPFVGILADKISVKLFVILAPAITVSVMSLIGIAPNYIFLAIILLVMGFSASMFHVPAPVMIKRISADRVGKGMSFFMLGGELARSVGPLVVLGGVSLWGLEGTYKLIPFGLTASIILFLRFRNLEVSSSRESKEAKKIIAALKEYSSLFTVIIGILFFTSIVKGTITTFLTVYLTDQGESLWYSGIALSIFQFAGAAGTFFSGTMSDKVGRRKIMILAAMVNPILLFFFIFSGGILSMILLVVMGFFLFAFTPVLLAIVNESKSEFPTFLNGVFMTINFLTSAVTITLIGISADLFGLQLTYYISSIFGLAVIPFTLKIKS